MKIYLLFLGILVGPQLICAQPHMAFNKTDHNFGNVANLNYPPAVFEFTNTGNQPLAILMVNKPNAVKVSYTKGFVQPGEKGQITVYPNLNQMGKFEETLSVVTNAQNSPGSLTISGEIVSIQACFPNPDNWNIRKVIVIDTDTKEPIANATIDFTHNMARNFQGKTAKNGTWIGEMPIGQYSFQLSAPKYTSKTESKYVPRSLPVIFLEMKMPAPTVLEEEIAISEPRLEVDSIQFTSNEVDNGLLPTDLYAANNIVLLLDVSYSMKSNQKLDLLKQSATNLVRVLRQIDNVSMITYAGSPTLVFKSVPGNHKEEINTHISTLEARGITNGVKGLESAYTLANAHYIPKGNNQIILATDGQFTGGTQQPDAFKNMIADYASRGIILSIIGFGVNEDAMVFMQEMAELGNGSYIHVNTKDDISGTLINEIKAKSQY